MIKYNQFTQHCSAPEDQFIPLFYKVSQKNNYKNKKIKSSVFWQSALSFFILSRILVTRNQSQAELPFWATIKKYPYVTLLGHTVVSRCSANTV